MSNPMIKQLLNQLDSTPEGQAVKRNLTDVAALATTYLLDIYFARKIDANCPDPAHLANLDQQFSSLRLKAETLVPELKTVLPFENRVAMIKITSATLLR